MECSPCLILQILYNYSNDNSVMLVKVQSHKSAEQNSVQEQTPSFSKYGQLIFDKYERQLHSQGIVFLKVELGYLDLHM